MANISQWFGSSYLSLGLAGTHYHSLGGDSNNSREEIVQMLWLETGTIRNFRFVLDDPVPPDNAVTVVFRINEVNTSLSVSLSPGDSIATSSFNLTVLALDRISIGIFVTGTGSGVSHAKWNFEFEPTTGSKSVYGHCSPDGTAQSPNYYGVFNGWGPAGGHNLRSECVSVSPTNGTLTRLGVINDPLAAGFDVTLADSHQWMFVKSTDNGVTWVDQDGTGGTPDTRVTLPHLGLHYNFANFSLSVDAGDLFYIRYDNLREVPTYAINVYGGVSCVFDPDVEGEFIVAGLSAPSLLGTVDVTYGAGAGHNGGFSNASPSGAITGITTIHVARFRAFLENAPGSGASYQFDFTKNGSTVPVPDGPFLLIANATQAAVDLLHGMTLRSSDRTFDIRNSPTNTPASGYMTWGLVGNASLSPVETLPRGNIGPIAWLVARRVQP